MVNAASPTISAQVRSCCHPTQSRNAGIRSVTVIAIATVGAYSTAAKIPSPAAANAISTAPTASHRHATSAPTETMPANTSCSGVAIVRPEDRALRVGRDPDRDRQHRQTDCGGGAGQVGELTDRREPVALRCAAAPRRRALVTRWAPRRSRGRSRASADARSPTMRASAIASPISPPPTTSDGQCVPSYTRWIAPAPANDDGQRADRWTQTLAAP